MVTTVSVSNDPEKTWQQRALEELETSLGHSLDMWTFEKPTGWTSLNDDSEWSSSASPDVAPTEATPELLALLDMMTLEKEVLVRQQSDGQHLLAIPLGKKMAATTAVTTDTPELLVGLANVGIRFFKQQEELNRLREENDFFLKQVSDDFEELTFLRSMAQRLGLGDSTHTIEQLVTASLPELGKSSHAEELYFVLDSAAGLQILNAWHTAGLEWDACETAVVCDLVNHFHRKAGNQAIIKNAFDTTDSNKSFPGVRDFILVPVGNENAPIGWFLAINRLAEEQGGNYKIPEWRLNQHEFGTSEASLLSTAAAMTASHANNLSLFQEREILLVNVVRTLVSAVEAKDQYTCGHSERVALYAKRLAKQMDYSEEACELLYLTGLLHDVGKIAINDAILNKPDRLTDEEFAEIQRHPEEGWKILQELQQLGYVLPGVLHHHERMDGKGYPDGLQGTDIPLDGRVLAVADAYDAMTSDRAYRTGMPHEKAISIIRDGAGTQWDAEAVDAFLAIEPEITEIRETYRPRKQPVRQPATPSSSVN